MRRLILSDGKELTIREARKADAANLLDYVNAISYESDFLTFGPGEFSMTLEAEEEFVEKCYQADNKIFLIAEIEGSIVGNLNFAGGARPRTRHTGEMGVSVLKKHWGKGIAGELISCLIGWSKEAGIIRKINLRVREDNKRAIRLYERFGFVKEGIVSRNFCIDGRFYSSIQMGLEID